MSNEDVVPEIVAAPESVTSAEVKMEDTAEEEQETLPAVSNQTLYVQSLPMKMKVPKLKKQLYEYFGQYGPVLEIVACDLYSLRGQAWIIFGNVQAAEKALAGGQDADFFGRKMRISYALEESDVVRQQKGTYKPRVKRKPGEKPATVSKDAMPSKPKKAKIFGNSEAASQVPPNKLLFIENLPEETTLLMLEMLFRQFPGFSEARLVPGKEGSFFHLCSSLSV